MKISLVRFNIYLKIAVFTCQALEILKSQVQSLFQEVYILMETENVNK
jgi:hypothetical protein